MLRVTKLQGAAGALTLIALLTSFAALVTPAWQVVYAREIQQWVQSGLWLNCQTRPSGMYTCTYTFSESDFQFYTSAELINLRTPPFFAWQRSLLAVFLLGQLCGFLALASLTLSFGASTRRLSALLNVAALSAAALLHVGALLAFAVFSQMVEYRFYHVSVSGIYEKHRGYSFFVEMAAVGVLAAALALAVAHLLRERVGRAKLNNNDGKNNSRRYYQRHTEQQQQMFDEEPYSYRNSNNNSNSNIFASNYSDAPVPPQALPSMAYDSATGPASYAGANSIYSFDHTPDLSLPYLPYASGGHSPAAASATLDERAFAMRALPKPPPPYR